MWWLQLGSLTILLLLWLPLLRLPAANRQTRRELLLPALFSLTWFSAGLCWLFISMHFYGGLPSPIAAVAVVLVAAYLSLYPLAAFAVTAALCRIDRRDAQPSRWLIGLVFASAWALNEWLRGLVFTGFPWLAIGYAHVDSPLIGWAPILGVYGVCALAALLAFLIAEGISAVRSGSHRRAFAPAAVAGMIALTGSLLTLVEWSQATGQPLRVRLLQGNVPQQLKFDPAETRKAMLHYARLVSARGTGPAPQLIVLPETAWTLPWAMTEPGIIDAMFPPAERTGNTSLVAIGMPLPVPLRSGERPAASSAYVPGSIANSVLLVRADAPMLPGPRYDKRHLVPFGEFVPWGFDWFVQMMNIPLGSFARGTADQPPFLVADQRVAFNICYEDLFGEELVASVRSDGGAATVLINVSNIAWFGHSHALGQHLEIARMRAIELARPMLRATNTGVTAAIDSRGQVTDQMANYTSGQLEVSVQGMRGDTPFVRWTHWPLLIVCAAVMILAHWQRRRVRAGYN